MIRWSLLLLFVVGLGILAVNGIKAKVQYDLAQPYAATAISPTPAAQNSKRIASSSDDTTSLFVPYWTLKNTDFSDSAYNRFLFFGITPTKNGINTGESGYAQLETFTASVPKDKDKILVLRMLDSDTNNAILKDSAKQNSVIAETIAVAKEQGFDGIVLDLELSAIPFDSLIAQIREFNSLFYTQTKGNDLSYGIAIYGDTFYRLRPFDIKAIAQKADALYIMSYDFHKSRGNPGPNFPLLGKETYGYDMATMSDEFLRFVPAEKITIVFGLFGYDWTVDAKGNAIAYGKALSYNEIASEFLNGCSYKACTIKRDTVSGETQITYTDEENVRHSVWYEDMESVMVKQAYLRGKGINAFSFWAHSYF